MALCKHICSPSQDTVHVCGPHDSTNVTLGGPSDMSALECVG